MDPKQNDARIAGLALATMVALYVGSGVVDDWPRWPAGVAAWVAALLLARRLGRAQAWQVGTLVSVGGIGLLVAVLEGGSPPWADLLHANAGLLTMIAAVSFLRLVALPEDREGAEPPRGPVAFRRTMLGVAVFGAFINISAPILIGEYLSRRHRLTRFEARSLTRVFSGCPAWSPFFGGMAVVLTLVQGMHLPVVMAVGLPFAVIGYWVVVGSTLWRERDDVERFEGYPMSVSGLRVPAILALCVTLGYLFLDVAVLVVIAVSAITVTSGILVWRHGLNGARRRFTGHVQFGLPGMAGELFLFLAAGVLAVGLRAAITAADFALPLHGFGATEASVLLLGMILVSAMGAHPVIFIVVVTPLLLPLAPEPNLLAVTYLFGWSLGTCASPLSGTHLIFQGRFGIPSLQGAMGNWPFVGVMAIVGVAMLHGLQAWLGP